jgi:hypothetical protein
LGITPTSSLLWGLASEVKAMYRQTVRDSFGELIGHVELLATRGEYKGVWRWTVGKFFNGLFQPELSGNSLSKDAAITEVYQNQE